jgi:antibiotic biosynthesis monooxygenase (ABM) superfamily enzyme
MARLAADPSQSSSRGSDHDSVGYPKYYDKKVPKWKYALLTLLVLIIAYCMYRLIR